MYLDDHGGAMIELCSDNAQMGDYPPARWPGCLKTINQGPGRRGSSSPVSRW
jgi:hypothetical protein